MSILVTGATGGLAASVIERLAAGAGEPVVKSSRALSRCEGHEPCDLVDPIQVSAMVGRIRPRLVFHLAGSFRNEFETDLMVNALSLRYLVEGLRTHGVDGRVVAIGSAAEYGMVNPSDNPISELQPLRPVSIYGLTKAIQTQIARWCVDALGADVVVARIFNITGAKISPRLFPGRVMEQIAQYRRGEINHFVFGPLQAERDFISDHEAARMLVLIAKRGVRGQVYNVGSGKPTSMRDLLTAMLDSEGIPEVPVVEATSALGTAPRFDVPKIYADVTKLRALESVYT